MLSESPCLPSVYEFLGLSDKLSFARVNKYWRFVSTTSPSVVIDTVGFDLSISRLSSLVSRNAKYLETLRVSVREPDIDVFVSFLLENLGQLERLESLAIFVSLPDGSVRLPIRDLVRFDSFTQRTDCAKFRAITSLVLQVDPSTSKSVQTLLRILGPNLRSVALLRGPGVNKSADLVSFITRSIPQADAIYLGPCVSDIDMDEVVPHIFANREGQEPIRYLQWSNASASIDTLRFVRSKVSECDFDGLGFLMFLL